MHNPAPVLENNTHKLLWDFDIHTDHHGIKLKECEKKDKYLDLARELKKTAEHAGDNYTNCNWCFWYRTKGLLKGLENFRLADEW